MTNAARHAKAFTLTAGLLVAMVGARTASAAPPADFDARVEAAMHEYGIPGMAIAIVEDGKTVLAKGYGVRRMGTEAPVDADTIFVLGSTSKAFTTAALAILVDEGKIGWDDKVTEHLPGFQMYDPWVTREITIRDLLVHRSGLGLGAGDLLFVPRTSRTRAEAVHSLRYIRPATSFRSGYAYDNVLYIVAGQLIEAVSGQTWEDFVRDRLLGPAGMKDATTTDAARFATGNRAQPHARTSDRIRGMGVQGVLDEREGLPQASAPAGGVAASANDMARWLTIQLDHGALPGAGEAGPRLFSEAASREMWTPQTLEPIQPYPDPIADATPKFSSYALGWSVHDYRGTRIIDHGGAVLGMQSLVTLVPERGVAFSMQINSEDSVPLKGLTFELLDHYLDAPGRDWTAQFGAYKKASLARGMEALEAAQSRAMPSKPSLPPKGYAGAYADPWYGPIRVTEAKGALRIDFEKTPGMAGTLEHWQYDTFRTHWDDATIEDAYVTFALDAEGKVERITMKPVSPLADFSYDYQDLLPIPVPAE